MSPHFLHPVTYCTNIHPAESWNETRRNVERYTLAVKRACCPDKPFPVGLRLSGRASAELSRDEALRFAEWMREQGLYVATLNGFPYGTFHRTAVKERVYLPDWRSRERLNYTTALADLLALWLPQGMTGSISTMPVAFGRELSDDDFSQARGNLLAALEHLARIEQDTGAFIRLSVEPEPGCFLETTPDMVEFVRRLQAPPELRRHMACCFDCCHQALQYEDPAESLALLQAAEIPVGHVQVSSALHLDGDNLRRLARFDESVYLHQAVASTAQGLERFNDLPPALQATPQAESWRVHFHLPVFIQSLPECRTTQGFLLLALPLFAPDTPLEVETYTWDVLPEDLRTESVTESIVREIQWVEKARRGQAGNPLHK